MFDAGQWSRKARKEKFDRNSVKIYSLDEHYGHRSRHPASRDEGRKRSSSSDGVSDYPNGTHSGYSRRLGASDSILTDDRVRSPSTIDTSYSVRGDKDDCLRRPPILSRNASPDRQHKHIVPPQQLKLGQRADYFNHVVDTGSEVGYDDNSNNENEPVMLSFKSSRKPRSRHRRDPRYSETTSRRRRPVIVETPYADGPADPGRSRTRSSKGKGKTIPHEEDFRDV